MFEDFRLKVFMSVAKSGSFTVAAKSLGISQPAVSQNISALEKELGVQLFLRARGEVSLTGEGMAFKEYAGKILYWYSATSEMFGAEGRLVASKPVRIAADPVVASYLVPQALSVLSAAHPEVTFKICPVVGEGRSGEIVSDVPGSHFGAPEDAEVEITVSPSPETMDFEGEGKLIGVMDAVVVASPLNRSVIGAAVSENDNEMTVKPFSTIAGIPVVNKFAVWDGYDNFFTPDLVARTALVSSSIEAIKTIVGESVCMLGILPAMSVKKEILSGRLLQMPVLLPDYAFDVHFNALPEFAGKTICHLLRKILRDNLLTM